MTNNIDISFSVSISISQPVFIDIVDIDDSSSFYGNQSKKDSKDQESIQSSTTPVPGYQMGK